MRTRANIHLDADAYDFASAYAAARGLALGAAISELLRRIEQMPKSANTESPRLKKTRRGFLVVAKTDQVITPEIVKEFTEDDLV
jgi:negative regulator of replication initiation